MKKVFNKLVLCLVGMLIISFASCSNSSGSGGDSETWTVVTAANKADLVGTWKASASMNGFKENDTYFVDADYSGNQKGDIDYSGASLEDYLKLLVNLKTFGFTCNDDTSAKKMTATRNFTSVEFLATITAGSIKLNAAKNKAKITDFLNNTVVYTKDSGGATIFSGTTWKCVNSGGEVDMLYKFAASDNKVTRTYNSTGITETTAYIFVAPRTAKIAAGTLGGAEDFVIDENDPNKATAGNGLTHFVKQ